VLRSPVAISCSTSALVLGLDLIIMVVLPLPGLFEPFEPFELVDFGDRSAVGDELAIGDFWTPVGFGDVDIIS